MLLFFSFAQECYEHFPDSIIFYIPQLVTFLLYGAFLNSSELEGFLLDKCARNVHFAHRMFWFLRAWCARADGAVIENNSEVQVITQILKKVCRRGEGPASLLQVGRGPGEDLSNVISSTSTSNAITIGAFREMVGGYQQLSREVSGKASCGMGQNGAEWEAESGKKPNGENRREKANENKKIKKRKCSQSGETNALNPAAIASEQQ